VAGDALTKHLSKILPALLSALSSKMDTPEETEVNYDMHLDLLMYTEGVSDNLSEIQEIEKKKFCFLLIGNIYVCNEEAYFHLEYLISMYDFYVAQTGNRILPDSRAVGE
jgi:hypothetical protein